MRFFALLDGLGAVVEQVQLEQHPCDPAGDCAPAYDWPRARVVEVERMGDLRVERLAPGGQWEFDEERLRRRVIEEIDLRRTLLDDELSSRPRHARKREEAARFNVGANPSAFPWLSSEAKELNESLEQTVEKVRAAIRLNEERLAAEEARLRRLKLEASEAETVSALLNLLEALA